MIEVVVASGGDFFKDFYPIMLPYSIMQGPEGISTIESLSMEQFNTMGGTLPTSLGEDRPLPVDNQRALLI